MLQQQRYLRHLFKDTTKLDRYPRGSAECHFCAALSFFSSNRIEVLLVLPGNESHQQKEPILLPIRLFLHKNKQIMKNRHFRPY
jgi:hypothetical protein